MARRTRLPKESYKRLMDVLDKARYEKPGTLARILLEAIIFDDGKLSASHFYLENAGPQGSFSKTRQKLINDEFISLNELNGRISAKQRLKPYIIHAEKPFPASIKYVNENIEIVNSRVDKVVDDVQDLKFQVNEIKDLLAELKRLQAPPPSEEAQRKSAVIAHRLNAIFAIKS